MPKFLYTSDWHWQNDQAGGLPLRRQAVKWTCDLVKERRPDLYGNLGDSSVAHGWIETDVLHDMVHGFRVIGATCDEVGATSVLLIGNHDQTDREGRISLAPAFQGAHRRIVERQSRFSVGDVVVGALAYCRDEKTFRERLESLGDVDVLLVHQDADGASWRPGTPPANAWLKPHEVKAPRVFGGHFHHPQIVSATDPQFVIVGSMFYMSHHDTLLPTPRGALWWDSDTNALEWIEFPFGPIYHSVPTDPRSSDSDRWHHLEGLANDPRAGRMRLRAKFASPDAVAAAEKTFAAAFETLRVSAEDTRGETLLPTAQASGFGWGREQAGPLLSDYVGRYAPPQGIDKALLAARGAQHLGLAAQVGGPTP